ncbi:MAG: Lrp/AsnC family transcriptional regulator [Planctomycetes bacterium]|nr:Lrp/AsnC family transcriptional regulator [Planctomycetota bacterium]
MDELDRKLLTALEDGFPLDGRPYARLAETVGLTVDDEAAVFERVMHLLDDGTIRRLGASFDSRRLGYEPTLVALRVPAARVGEAAATVNRYREVTHNYERSGSPWSLWFTVIARSRERQDRILAEIRRDLGLAAEDMMTLPVERLYKIDVRFVAR